MPRVNYVKKARKDNPVCKRGESYFWWKFRYGGKRFSLTRPRPSQLTQSAYYGTLRGMVEGIEDYEVSDFDDFETLKDDITSQLDDLRSETQDSLDNMPESLQYSPTGELLQERIDALENAEYDMDVDEFEFDEEDFTREPFDDDEEFDSDEDRDTAEADHEHEQDELESDHEQDQQEMRTAEFETWMCESKDALIEAVSNCEL